MTAPVRREGVTPGETAAAHETRLGPIAPLLAIGPRCRRGRRESGYFTSRVRIR